MKKKKVSLKMIVLRMVFLCWLIPILLMVGVMGYYALSRQEDNRISRLVDQMEANNRICQERLDGAIVDSRRISYDKTIREKYEQYQAGTLSYQSLYATVRYYLTVEYSRKKAISFAALALDDVEDRMDFSVMNSSAGGSYQEIVNFWEKDYEAVADCAEKLDTAIGFVESSGRLYLVRNMMNSRFKPWGRIILCLNKEYCFEALLNGQEEPQIVVELNEQEVFREGLEGEELPELDYSAEGQYRGEKKNIYLTHKIKTADYQLNTLLIEKREELPAPLYGYQYVVMGMLACLIPLCILMLSVFRKQVSTPIGEMMKSAEEIEEGNLGFQIEHKAESQEFQYLQESFNHMSQRLKYQFDHIYQEELALRDARIMALQSHINPHFMNNTLEIINWEARMAGNDKVSEMIGALGTLLDAAMDRKKQPEVPLSEELVYVNAYLYIMKERFGNRLQVIQDIPEELLEYQVPRLILQPVLENAIEHGILPKGRGCVNLSGYRKEEYLILEVTNNGTLTPEDEERILRLLAPDYNASRENSGNLGIANVNQRLRILYGEDSGLFMHRKGKEETVARLQIRIGQKAKNIQEMPG